MSDSKTNGRQLAREKVYIQLRKWIIEGDLMPGEKLNDIELANQLGVSRTPVRESLRSLEDEGYIETYAHQWTRVAQINMDQVKEMFHLIWELELLCLKFAGDSIKKLNTSEMRECNKRIDGAIRNKEIIETLKFDSEFHNFFIASSKNEELIRMLGTLKLKLRRFNSIYFNDVQFALKSVEEHNQIIDNLEAGNIRNVKHDLKRHWKNSMKRGSQIEIL